MTKSPNFGIYPTKNQVNLDGLKLLLINGFEDLTELIEKVNQPPTRYTLIIEYNDDKPIDASIHNHKLTYYEKLSIEQADKIKTIKSSPEQKQNLLIVRDNHSKFPVGFNLEHTGDGLVPSGDGISLKTLNPTSKTLQACHNTIFNGKMNTTPDIVVSNISNNNYGNNSNTKSQHMTQFNSLESFNSSQMTEISSHWEVLRKYYPIPSSYPGGVTTITLANLYTDANTLKALLTDELVAVQKQIDGWLSTKNYNTLQFIHYKPPVRSDKGYDYTKYYSRQIFNCTYIGKPNINWKYILTNPKTMIFELHTDMQYDIYPQEFSNSSNLLLTPKIMRNLIRINLNFMQKVILLSWN